jgi:hypothetical protein
MYPLFLLGVFYLHWSYVPLYHYYWSPKFLFILLYYFHLTHSLTHSWSWALLEKLPIVQLLKNFPEFYGTRRFITVFTRALHWSLSWARWIQSIPSHHISLRFILILSTHLRLGLPNGLLPSGFAYMHSSSPHTRYMSCPSCPPWLDHSHYTWRRVQVILLLPPLL